MTTNNLIYIGEKEEINNFVRIIRFENEELDSMYAALNLDFKKSIQNLLNTFLGEDDFFGFNLKKILDYFTINNTELSQNKFSGFLSYVEKMNRGLTLSNSTITTTLKRAMKYPCIPKDTNLERLIYDLIPSLAIDIELLTKGHGTIYRIKDEWFDRYLEDMPLFNEKLLTSYHGNEKWYEEPLYINHINKRKIIEENKKKISDFENRKNEAKYNQLAYIRLYEEYLQNRGELPSNESILMESDAIIVESGKFLLLRTIEGREREIEAVKNLVRDLYNFQMQENFRR